MCTSPLLILNKKYRWLKADTPRKYIQVPCGSCDECLRRRAADLYVRAQYEYQYCIKNGGIGFMCCLTYSNDLLPYLDINGKKYMVFNKKDVIDFIKRLRIILDRYYHKHYKLKAPVFKYFVASEYGSDPTRSHRPHYHAIFFFKDFIAPRLFRWAFNEATYNRKTGDRYFGIIKQCDIIDPKRGGIRYSAKYVLKDLMFETQRKYIINYLNHETDKIEQEFGIIPFPSSAREEFKNKCIRNSKAYSDAVRSRCMPYRHMLQFYMCSNDFGVSAILYRYGNNLSSVPVLSLGGFTFALPKSCKRNFTEIFGAKKGAELSKSVFVESFRVAANSLLNEGLITYRYINLLIDFIKRYVYYESGFPILALPCGTYEHLFNSFEFPSFDEKEEEGMFMLDNDFYHLRSDLLRVIRLYNSPSRIELRKKVAFSRSQQEKQNYEQKKRNNYAKF